MKYFTYIRSAIRKGLALLWDKVYKSEEEEHDPADWICLN